MILAVIAICVSGCDAKRGNVFQPGDPQLTWLEIPFGDFDMGCSRNDTQCFEPEKPTHRVIVQSFEMTETEITQAQYYAVTGKTPSSFAGCPLCPVENVTWDQARSYCEAVGARLPSEAEWEYAARARTYMTYSCGDHSWCLYDIAWYSYTAEDKPFEVAAKRPNSFGLYDMFGNVWEWTADCAHENYNGAPDDGGVWEDEQCLPEKVIRGGGWGSVHWMLRASQRDRVAPSFRENDIGFRCARDYAGPPMEYEAEAEAEIESEGSDGDMDVEALAETDADEEVEAEPEISDVEVGAESESEALDGASRILSPFKSN